MNLFVPDIGTRLKLTENWNVIIQDEYRVNILEKMGITSERDKKYLIIIPKDTILTVKKIYVRQGNATYSSVSFSIKKKDCPNNKLMEGSKFWASLSDVNRLQFELETCNEETLESITLLYDNLKKTIPGNPFNKIVKTIFSNGNIVKLRPQEDGYIFFQDMFSRIEKDLSFKSILDKEKLYDEVMLIINKGYRKYKLRSLIEEI